MSGPAAQRWTSALAGWAIPPHIMAAAPEPPWGFSTALFAARTEQALAQSDDTPSRFRAVEALPDGGSVLDVGVGGGAGSLPLTPPAGLIVGVDPGADMLAAFAAAADRRGVAHRELQGSWPAAADEVEDVDVVVCHNVFYNVADLVPFAAALTVRARRRVVVEITAEHPTAAQRPLWRALHGLDRPTSPTAEDVVAVLVEMGLDVSSQQFERQGHPPGVDPEHRVAMTRRRLCVGAERDPQIRALLEAEPAAPRRAVTIWWDGQA